MSKWDETLKFYDKLVSQCPDFERKGKKMIFTSDNGYMFSLLNKAGEIGIRLPKETAKVFLETYKDSGEYRSYGAKMKDYVLVPETLYKNPEVIIKYLKKSHAYVLSLPKK